MKRFLISFFESIDIDAEDSTEALEIFAEHIKEMRYGTICEKCNVEELDSETNDNEEDKPTQ